MCSAEGRQGAAPLGAAANDGQQAGFAAAAGPHEREHLTGTTATRNPKQDLHSHRWYQDQPGGLMTYTVRSAWLHINPHQAGKATKQ